MTPKQLRAFVAVARYRSFAKAAESLHISQPALSLAVKSLEASLGGALLRRTTRYVDLTDDGAALFVDARRILADWARTESHMRQRFRLARGRLLVAAIPSFAVNVLPNVLQAFREQHPALDITIEDVINEEVVARVLDRRVELGIAFEPPPAAPIQFEPIQIDRFVAALPASSPLQAQASVSWADLGGYGFVALQHPSTVRRLLEARQPNLQVSTECHQLSTVGRLVSAGLGASAVPSICQDQMIEMGCICRPLTDPVVERAIGLVTLPGAALSQACEQLVTHLKAAVIDPAHSDELTG